MGCGERFMRNICKKSLIALLSLIAFIIWFKIGFVPGILLGMMTCIGIGYFDKSKVVGGIVLMGTLWLGISTLATVLDPKVIQFEEEFDQSISCSDTYDDDGDTYGRACNRDYDGSIETKLESYLKTQHVFSIGGWHGDYSYVGNQLPYEGVATSRIYLYYFEF